MADMTSTPYPAGYVPPNMGVNFRPGAGVWAGRGTQPGTQPGATGYSRQDISRMYGDPTLAKGTPYEQFIRGGGDTGAPVSFMRGPAMWYERSGGAYAPGVPGISGPGALSAWRRSVSEQRQQARGASAPPDAQPDGIMYANGALAPGADGVNTPTGGMPTHPVPPMSLRPMDTGSTQPGVYGAAPGAAPAQYYPVGAPSAPYTNPYLTGQINSLGQQTAQDFNRNVLPGIRDQQIANGGYGGSADGIAQGIAAGDTMRNFTNASMGLLGNDWTNAQNRYLTNQQQMLGFASDQRAQDRADLSTGASLYGAGTQGPWTPVTSANGIYGQYTGFPTQTSSQGGGVMGALGGALGGLQIANFLNGGGTQAQRSGLLG